MKKSIAAMTMLFLLLILAGATGWAADQERERVVDRDRLIAQDRLSDRDMYGWEMMSREEREEHRARIRSFTNEAEREQYRLEHHDRMEERARTRGVTLPDMPGARGQGPGSGAGMGAGGGGRR